MADLTLATHRREAIPDLPPAVQAENFEVLRKYTQEFDKVHGTRLWDAIKEVAAATP